LTVVVPARNEAAGIGDCLRSLQAAAFVGTRTIVVVDDGSDDDTARIAEGFGVTVIRTEHLGKARAINAALRVSHGELVAVVDADSVIAPDALVEAAARFTAPEVAAVCATVKVRNRRTLLGMWLHIEQLFNSVLRAAFAKLNATIVTPGPLSVYRRAALDRVGGFSPDGYSEDVDIALRLLAAGYRVDAAPRAISETTMPVSARGFVRQRLRFTRGWIHVFRAHLRPGRTAAALLALPLALYGFAQSVVMSALMTTALAGAYAEEVARHGSLVRPAPLFVLYRLSLYGLVSVDPRRRDPPPRAHPVGRGAARRERAALPDLPLRDRPLRPTDRRRARDPAGVHVPVLARGDAAARRGGARGVGLGAAQPLDEVTPPAPLPRCGHADARRPLRASISFVVLRAPVDRIPCACSPRCALRCGRRRCVAGPPCFIAACDGIARDRHTRSHVSQPPGPQRLWRQKGPRVSQPRGTRGATTGRDARAAAGRISARDVVEERDERGRACR
jgi:hypothetical protein